MAGHVCKGRFNRVHPRVRDAAMSRCECIESLALRVGSELEKRMLVWQEPEHTSSAMVMELCSSPLSSAKAWYIWYLRESKSVVGSTKRDGERGIIPRG